MHVAAAVRKVDPMLWGSVKHFVLADTEGLSLVRDGVVEESVPWHRLRRVELDVPVAKGWRRAGWWAALAASVVADAGVDGPEGYGEITARIYTDVDGDTTDTIWIVPAHPERGLSSTEAKQLCERIYRAILDPRLRPELATEGAR